MSYPSVTLACHAMATRFEVVLPGENVVGLRAAGEEALREIERIEGQLSLYRNTSEIAHVNARAAREPVRVSPSVFRLLELAQQLSDAMEGAFDVTIAPLVRCWGFMGGTGHLPKPEALNEARQRVGMKWVSLDPKEWTVRFLRDGMMIDLGAIGKGYAIECAVDILRDAGIASALIHGGTSSIYALGSPPGAREWKIGIEPVAGSISYASAEESGLGVRLQSDPQPGPEGDDSGIMNVIPLRDEALSVSAIWGRTFQSGGRNYGHVIDPRSGQPVDHSVLAAVVLPSAPETDALSTALLTLGTPGLSLLRGFRPDVRALLVPSGEGQLSVTVGGLSWL